MDKYIIKKKESNTTNFGELYNSIYEQKFRSYGESSRMIRENVINLYNKIEEMEKPKNVLVVGKVQSGKTANLELLSGLLFDNSYNVGIIFGGIDNTLLSQTVNRFTKTFEKFDDKVIILHKKDDDNKSFQSISPELINMLISKNNRILIIPLKSQKNISDLSKIFSQVDKTKLKSFIIDDEGDQASLNTEFKKRKESATYKSITKLLKSLDDPLYLTVTATPHANIFSPELSEIKPRSVALIYPSEGYVGGNEFHLTGEHLKIIDKNNNEEFDFYKSLIQAIIYYIIASSCLRKFDGVEKTNMIIHNSPEIKDHKNVSQFVRERLKIYKEILASTSNPDSHILYEEFKKEFNKYEEFQGVDFKEIQNEISEVIEFLLVDEHNMKGKDPNAQYYDYKINVGGNLLQRGVTFENLVCTFFTREPKGKSNMDTTLQRARWFGYRSVEILKYMKIFTTNSISSMFSELVDIENDIWSQISEVIDGSLLLDDITIQANDNLNPTRQNVAEWNKEVFKRKWYDQRIGIFNKKEISNIDKNVEILLGDKKELVEIYDGGNDGRVTGRMISVKNTIAINFFESSKNVFNLDPLRKIFEYDFSSSDIVDIILINDKDRPRKRTFYNNNKISALKQGADTIDLENKKYKGDSFVINNRDRVTVHIYTIIPEKNEILRKDSIQYMFAIYFPISTSRFRRKP